MAYTTIDDPSAHFQATTYTGTNSSGNAITNSGNSDLQPDMVWIKVRTYNNPHIIQDTSRGFAGNGEINLLQSASTSQELTNGAFESFDSNGFTVGGTNPTSRAYNGSTDNYIAWQWKANGGTTASNTDGNTTTTVQANQDAGFSIVTYTGTGSASQTMGHGLGVTPNIVLTKARSGTSNWSFNGNFGGMTYGTNRLLLNTTAALTADTNEVTAASSTTFTGGGSSGVNSNGATYVAYCFAEKQGYSKFGSYVGNGSANGVFVYTGFKPAFILVKEINITSWGIWDNKRSPSNAADKLLLPNSSDADYTGSPYSLDILSNGFKLRTTDGAWNGNSDSYIYMAFAEHPFTTSTGIPTTAR